MGPVLVIEVGLTVGRAVVVVVPEFLEKKFRIPLKNPVALGVVDTTGSIVATE